MKSEHFLKPYAYEDLLLVRWRYGVMRPSVFKILVNDVEVPKPIFGIKLSDDAECLLVANVNDLKYCEKATVRINDEAGDEVAASTKRMLKPFTERDFRPLPLQDRLRTWEGLLNRAQKTFPAVSDELVRKIAVVTASKDAYCVQLSQELLYFRTAWPNSEPSRVIVAQIRVAFMDGGDKKIEKLKSLIDDAWIHCVIPIPETYVCDEVLVILNDGAKTVALKFPNAKKLPVDEPQNSDIILKQYKGNQTLVSDYIEERVGSMKLDPASLYDPDKDTDGPVHVTIDSVAHIPGIGLLINGSIVDQKRRIQSIKLHRQEAAEIDLLQDSIKVSRPDIHSQFLARGVFLNSCALGFHRLIPETGDTVNHSPIDFTMRLTNGLRFRLPSNKPRILDPKDPLPTDISFGLLESLQTVQRRVPPEKSVGMYQSLTKWAENSESSLKINSTPLIADPVYLVIETAILIPEAGLFLSGWKIDLGENIQSIKVIDLTNGPTVIADKLIAGPRPDVYNHYCEKGLSLANNDLGFHCLVPISLPNKMALLSVLTISCRTGEVYRLPIKAEEAKLNDPLSTIKKLLLTFTQNHSSLRRLLDECIGPSVRTLWKHRKVPDLKPILTSFGKLPRKPEVSIIVPLYGRTDFVLHQLSLFADDPDFQENELIYVLDDPALYPSLINKCQDVAPLFNVPFKLVYGGYNMGYAGANNLGAQLAMGDYFVFLNSDVMPKESGWVKRLTETYKALPRAGVIGTKLLYADGSIQHVGMAFEKSTDWDGLWINDHPYKGHPNTNDSNAQHIKKTSITAACIMLQKSIFYEIGGFTEDYIIGDFEDSDLCLKSHKSGYQNWYIPSVELYHLERQSQSMPDNAQWRYHLTLYNCWIHTQKWSSHIHKIKTEGDSS